MENNKFKNQITALIYIIVSSVVGELYVIIGRYLINYSNITYNNTQLVWFNVIYPILIGLLFSVTSMKIKGQRNILLIGLLLNIIIILAVWYILLGAISTYNLIFVGILLFQLFNRKNIDK